MILISIILSLISRDQISFLCSLICFYSDNLVTKTTDLEAGAAVFRDQTKVVRRKMWWKNTKMNLILGTPH